MQEPICFGVVGGSGLALNQPVTAANPLPVTFSGGPAVTVTPSASSTVAVAPTQSGNALAANAVLKAAAGNLYGINVFSTAAGYLLVYDATSAPADGAVPVSLRKVVQVAANQAVDVEFPTPVRFTSGITAVFSSTAPMTQTSSATAYISAQVT